LLIYYLTYGYIICYIGELDKIKHFANITKVFAEEDEDKENKH
jgi:hypothetical protein